MNNIVSDAINYANQFAEQASPKLKKVAFQTALEHYLTEHGMQTNRKTADTKKKAKVVKSIIQKYLDRLLQSEFEWSSTNILRLSPLGQYLKILKIAKIEFQIDNLSSDDIRKILNEKFRINKTVNAISMSLMASIGKYVDRTRQGNEYYYKITISGEKQLEKLEKKLGEKYA